MFFVCWGVGVGEIIKDIDAGSPAEEAGLKSNDLLVAVNGEPVESLDHDCVVEMIRKGGDQTSLLVVDKETENMYRMVSGKGASHSAGMKPSSGASPALCSGATSGGVQGVKPELWLWQLPARQVHHLLAPYFNFGFWTIPSSAWGLLQALCSEFASGSTPGWQHGRQAP